MSSPSAFIRSNAPYIGNGPDTDRSARNIHRLLRPAVRAYLLGYAFTVGPRLLSLIRHQILLQLRKRRRGQSDHVVAKEPQALFLQAVRKTLTGGLDLDRFATFCAALVGGCALLESVLRKAFASLLQHTSEKSRTRLSRWFSSAIAAWFSIQLLQSPRTVVHSKTDAITESNSKALAEANGDRPQAGRTLDLTLFAATRALDVIVGEVWSQRRRHLAPSHSRTTRSLDRFTSQMIDPLIFATTSGMVMWNWFYSPNALPHAYNKWIASAASVDKRLIIALQRCRNSTLRYGEDTGQAPLLQEMCREYEWPLEWGDPAVSIPFPCEVVHMGCGPSCELHALTRFACAWWWSLKMYLPLQFAMFLLRLRRSKSPARDLLRTFTSASKSSAFLGTFITLFYYGVCLARTRLGPHILGTSTEARQKIDSGICVGTGCFLCGWSVLLESASRRKELALFVAPRAVATMLPRRYDTDKQWMERLAFAVSTAVVFTCVLENKQRVRGILGRVLGMVLTG